MRVATEQNYGFAEHAGVKSQEEQSCKQMMYLQVK